MAKQAFKVHVPEMIAISDLNPVAYNPRKITPKKFEALKESIRADGFLEPIVVQKTGLAIIGGHQRVKAMKELCVEAGVQPPQIPCVMLDVDDRTAKKLNVKLNAIGGEFDARMLGEVLVDINSESRMGVEEIESLGFTEEEAGKYIELVEPADMSGAEDDGKDFAKSVTLSLAFKDVRMRDALKKELKKRAEVEKKLTGDIVAELLTRPGRKAKRKPNGRGTARGRSTVAHS